jgi:hypothetical protein
MIDTESNPSDRLTPKEQEQLEMRIAKVREIEQEKLEKKKKATKEFKVMKKMLSQEDHYLLTFEIRKKLIEIVDTFELPDDRRKYYFRTSNSISNQFTDFEIAHMYLQISSGDVYIWKDVYRDFCQDLKPPGSVKKIFEPVRRSLPIEIQKQYLDYWIKRVLLKDNRIFGKLNYTTIDHLKQILTERLLDETILKQVIDNENNDEIVLK